MQLNYEYARKPPACAREESFVLAVGVKE